MDPDKKKALEAAGWKFGSVEEFLGKAPMSDVTDKDLELLEKQGWIRIDECNWQSPLGTCVVDTEKALEIAKDAGWLEILALFGKGDQ